MKWLKEENRQRAAGVGNGCLPVHAGFFCGISVVV
jgi:hypothetical protein